MTDRPIPGWPGYRATADGQIIGPAGRPLRPWSHYRTGHLRVRLYGSHAPLRADTVRGALRARRCATIYVHRLVALAWHGQPGEAVLVRHLDDDPTNNAPTNLRWGSRLENARDRLINADSVDDDGFDWETGEQP